MMFVDRSTELVQEYYTDTQATIFIIILIILSCLILVVGYFISNTIIKIINMSNSKRERNSG